MSTPRVRLGLERLLSDDVHLLIGKNVGLICNASTITSGVEHAADLFAADPRFRLTRLFGPEHGIRGDAQDMIPVEEEGIDRLTGVPVHSLYGKEERSLWPTEESLRGLDVLVFDVQDVGARYYTFAYTMAHAMEVAGRVALPIIVCDRPNPIGGVLVEGNTIHDGFRSFVGRYPLPNRHGLTVGELAMWFRDTQGISCDLHICWMDGWERAMSFAETGLPWVLPSPNMPTPDTALVYPGQCLFEGTLLSEGRGHTRPFEVVGAPYVDGALWARESSASLAAIGVGGLALRPLVFRPTFHKFAGQGCGGVQLHVTDATAFRPLITSIALLHSARRLWPHDFAWRTERYEYVEAPIAIDLLAGDARLREEIDSGAPLSQIRERLEDEGAHFRAERPRFCHYR